jgi:hypothetical protein
VEAWAQPGRSSTAVPPAGDERELEEVQLPAASPFGAASSSSAAAAAAGPPPGECVWRLELIDFYHNHQMVEELWAQCKPMSSIRLMSGVWCRGKAGGGFCMQAAMRSMHLCYAGFARQS